MRVYLEIGKKRVFAGAVDWPGWCRRGRDEEAALQALIDCGPRYARALRAIEPNGHLDFQPPERVSDLTVVERLAGTSTTDFGAPDVAPAQDAEPISEPQRQRFQMLLQACWAAFDEAVQAAAGKELRKGPRGGGRDLEGIVQHVLGADANYLRRLAWTYKQDKTADSREELRRTRQAILDALAAAIRGELPAQGPRGGTIWQPRYFVRRVAWHALDHAWEIQDRLA